MGQRAYCDRWHPADDADADGWCARYHRAAKPRPRPAGTARALSERLRRES